MRSIDIHTHGIGGFDTRSSTVDDLLRIAEIHGASGVSEIVLSIYPAPIKTMRQQVELVAQAMEYQRSAVSRQPSAGTVNTAFDPQSLENSGNWNTRKRVADPKPDAGVARILGVHLEGPFLNPAHCGALDPAFFIEPEETVIGELIEGLEDVIRIITIAPERRAALALIRMATELGIVVSMGHSDATYAEAEAGFNAGARGITHLFNAMRAFHHREPGLAGFALTNKHIYAEIIADPFHLHFGALDLAFKSKAPDRIILVSDSIKETKRASSGGIVDNSGRLQGGSMTVVESARRLIDLGFDESPVMNAITMNPRRYLMLTEPKK